jgi:hypothetical protein
LLRNQENPECVSQIISYLKEIKMDKRDQELLAKQLWSVSSPRQNDAIIGLIIVAVFLVGIGVGDILSKSKQANTNYAAMVSRIAEAPP